MGKGFFDLEANPRTAPPKEPGSGTEAKTYRDRLEEAEHIEALKLSISQQLTEGSEPQFILYTAIRAIAILTQDPEWGDAGAAALDAIYGDLAQESLLIDRATVAAHRLNEKRAEYSQKLRAQAQRQLSGCKKLEADLQAVLRTLNELEAKDEPIF